MPEHLLTETQPTASSTPITAETLPWRVVGASAIGTGHVKTGLPCQDAFAYQQTENSLMIAVADGAGSAALSHEGSALAVETALASLTTQLTETVTLNADEWSTVITTTFEATRSALIDHAVAAGMPLRDYATTLLLLVLTDSATVSGMIGDCLAVMLNQADALTVLTVPQKGEYANTTNFLTQDDALDMLDIQHIDESPAGVAAFSDGLQTLAVNIAQNKPHAPFFNPLFAFTAAAEEQAAAAQQLAEFLNSDRLNERTDDDKTIVLARRLQSEA